MNIEIDIFACCRSDVIAAKDVNKCTASFKIFRICHDQPRLRTETEEQESGKLNDKRNYEISCEEVQYDPFDSVTDPIFLVSLAKTDTFWLIEILQSTVDNFSSYIKKNKFH